jgi:hypothetical protein
VHGADRCCTTAYVHRNTAHTHAPTHGSLYLVAQHFIHTGSRGSDTRENALNPVLKLVDRAYGEVVAGLVILRLLVGLRELFFQVADGLFALGVAGRVL